MSVYDWIICTKIGIHLLTELQHEKLHLRQACEYAIQVVTVLPSSTYIFFSKILRYVTLPENRTHGDSRSLNLFILIINDHRC